MFSVRRGEHYSKLLTEEPGHPDRRRIGQHRPLARPARRDGSFVGRGRAGARPFGELSVGHLGTGGRAVKRWCDVSTWLTIAGSAAVECYGHGDALPVVGVSFDRVPPGSHVVGWSAASPVAVAWRRRVRRG